MLRRDLRPLVVLGPRPIRSVISTAFRQHEGVLVQAMRTVSPRGQFKAGAVQCGRLGTPLKYARTVMHAPAAGDLWADLCDISATAKAQPP